MRGEGRVARRIPPRMHNPIMGRAVYMNRNRHRDVLMGPAWGVPEPKARLELFRLFLIFEFPCQHLDVPRWIFVPMGDAVKMPLCDQNNGI